METKGVGVCGEKNGVEDTYENGSKVGDDRDDLWGLLVVGWSDDKER